MLCMNKYAQKYIEDCRKKVDVHLGTYRKLATTAKKQNATSLNAALQSFEPAFFNNMILVLDGYFTHRSRTIEGKLCKPAASSDKKARKRLRQDYRQTGNWGPCGVFSFEKLSNGLENDQRISF